MNRCSRDPYEILGVSHDASEKEIRKRYRRLCKRYHPDLNNGDPQSAEVFKEVKWAYDTIVGKKHVSDDLSNPTHFPGFHQDAGKADPFFAFFHAVKEYCMKMKPNKES